MKAEIVAPEPCPRCKAAPGHVGECLEREVHRVRAKLSIKTGSTDKPLHPDWLPRR